MDYRGIPDARVRSRLSYVFVSTYKKTLFKCLILRYLHKLSSWQHVACQVKVGMKVVRACSVPPAP
jgi:hypothetical protein